MWQFKPAANVIIENIGNHIQKLIISSLNDDLLGAYTCKIINAVQREIKLDIRKYNNGDAAYLVEWNSDRIAPITLDLLSDYFYKDPINPFIRRLSSNLMISCRSTRCKYDIELIFFLLHT